MRKYFACLLAVGCFQLSAQTKITSIPFELFGDHMFIKVSVDQSAPLDFIFDTGSGLTVLDKEVADKMKLIKKEVVLNEAKSQMVLIKHNTIEINGFLMEKNINVYAADLNHLEISLGRDFDGILGYDLLHHHTVHIDYDNLMMDIYDHGDGPKEGDAIPFTLMTTIPTIEGSVVLNNKEEFKGLFFVMTGAGTTLDLNSPAAAQWDAISKTGKHYSYPVKGLGKEETLHFEGHVESFTFGNQTVEDLPIGISTAKSGIQADSKVAGIIGNRILREFNITIDVPDKMIWIKKNSHFGEKFNVNSSGIDLQMSKDMRRVMIHRVFEDSPADVAGIKENAELVSIDGKLAVSIPLPEIQAMLRRSGQAVPLVVKQSGKENEVVLKLKSLLEE
jgi:predicted aspartyl protease